MKNKEKVKPLLAKLKVLHPLWKEADEAHRARIEKSLEPDFVQLEKLGVSRYFGESLLYWGKEFAQSFVLNSKNRSEIVIEDAEAIFGASALELTDIEKRAAKLAQKAGAVSYRILPEKGGKIGIEVLDKTTQESLL